MKKVFLFIAFALGLSASVVNAQETARTVGGNTPSQSRIGIQFLNENCAGSGFSCFVITLRTASRQVAANELNGTTSSDAAGNLVVNLDGKSNPDLVKKLRANGKLDLKNDATISPEVTQQTGRSQAVVLPRGTYPVTGSATARGRIVITIGKVTIIITW